MGDERLEYLVGGFGLPVIAGAKAKYLRFRAVLLRIVGRRDTHVGQKCRRRLLKQTRLIGCPPEAPKPARAAYVELCERYAIAPGRAVMIDDIPGNLAPAAEIGMTTVWKKTDAEWAVTAEVSGYVHHVTDDLLAWLRALSTLD